MFPLLLQGPLVDLPMATPDPRDPVIQVRLAVATDTSSVLVVKALQVHVHPFIVCHVSPVSITELVVMGFNVNNL